MLRQRSNLADEDKGAVYGAWIGRVKNNVRDSWWQLLAGGAENAGKSMSKFSVSYWIGTRKQDEEKARTLNENLLFAVSK